MATQHGAFSNNYKLYTYATYAPKMIFTFSFTVSLNFQPQISFLVTRVVSGV